MDGVIGGRPWKGDIVIPAAGVKGGKEGEGNVIGPGWRWEWEEF